MKQLKTTTYGQDSIRKKYMGLFPSKIVASTMQKFIVTHSLKLHMTSTM